MDSLSDGIKSKWSREKLPPLASLSSLPSLQCLSATAAVQRWTPWLKSWREKDSCWAASPARTERRSLPEPPSTGTSDRWERRSSGMWVHQSHPVREYKESKFMLFWHCVWPLSMFHLQICIFNKTSLHNVTAYNILNKILDYCNIILLNRKSKRRCPCSSSLAMI